MMIPTISKDYIRVKHDFKQFFDFLSVQKITLVGPADLEDIVYRDAQNYGVTGRIGFINENEVLAGADVKKAMDTRLLQDNIRLDGWPGWYYQQFLKMAYAYVCESDYYLAWDADTIPVRIIDLFDREGGSYLDTKAEYNARYFNTIKKLFGMEKAIEKSFVAEHILYKKEHVLEMISEIENLDLTGDKFFEKILYAINIQDIKSGFSEYETYGTWAVNRHPDDYAIREWSSMRNAGIYIDSFDLTYDDISYLGMDFDAASFERYHYLVPELAELFRNQEYRMNIRAVELYKITMESGLYGELVDGMLKEGDIYKPI